VARIFVTGSSDGLGLMAAKLLIAEGHQVMLHGRNDGRSRDALAAASVPGELFPGTSPPAPAQGPLRRRLTSSVDLTL
jgi:NAD(P)-dependent dehydrogenase (short-subunit alcohol dehydrogenase family)